jgi:hypothetical protein
MQNKFTKNGGFYFCRRSAENKVYLLKKKKLTAEQKQNIEQKITLRHRQRRRGLKRQNIILMKTDRGGGG